MGYGAPNYSKSAGSSSSGGGSSASQDKSVTAYQVSVNTETLNVRSTPSTSGTLLTTVSRGTALTVSATNGDWLKVSFTKNGSTVTGYVSGAYVTKTGTSSSSSSASSNTSASSSTAASTAMAATTASSTASTAAASAGADGTALTGLYVYAQTDQLEVGEKVQLNYELKPAGAEAEVAYETDSDLVRLSRDGEVEAVGPGEATVVVTADNISRSYTFYITGEPAAAQSEEEAETAAVSEPDTDEAEPAAVAGGDVLEPQEIQNTGAEADENLDLKITFIASGACVVGAVGCIPVIRKRRRTELVTLGERIEQLKK
ncbi:MAG: SH3 domain-containing protein [Clostridiales bacterium]|nr:SH3 domain-containing protein [Clostridiales bacterium]